MKIEDFNSLSPLSSITAASILIKFNIEGPHTNSLRHPIFNKDRRI
jgi:hypothetical protein